MSSSHHTHEPTNLGRVKERLAELFDHHQFTQFEEMSGGYLCQNFVLKTNNETFFLKQYRNRISGLVHEIKEAEQFFAQRGIPVITPIPDKFGRAAFLADRHWYSLFPFIHGHTINFGSLTEKNLASMGEMLGRIHHAGRLADHEHFQPLRLGDKARFTMEVIELRHELEERKTLSALEQRILEVLNKKEQWVRANRLPPKDIHLPFDALLHGDFLYQNVFVGDLGDVTHVFDWEKTCNGPRAFEVARSLIINCFDDGWAPENFAHARMFLEAYTRIQPMDTAELLTGIRLYVCELMHMTWIEGKYVIHGIDTQMPLYERHAKRIEWLGEHLDDFCARIKQLK